MTACLIHSALEHCIFYTDISQGSVVTQLRCGIVNDDFVANLLKNLSVKEF